MNLTHMNLALWQMVECLGLPLPLLPSPSADSWNQVPSSVIIDSREVSAGSLFVCVKGINADGHNFAQAAVQQGACAILAQRNPFAANSVAPVPVILVEDVVKALGKIANRHRKNMQGKVIGITGTAGKTTVKEVLAQILSRVAFCEKSPMNKNNQLGLPLSMLASSDKADFWIMELGISLPHDMDELGAILEPDYGVIINVGEGHLEGLGRLGVAYHKARLLKYLSESGEGIVSTDYPDLRREALLTGKPIFFFGADNTNVDCHSSYIGSFVDSAINSSSGVKKGIYSVTWFNHTFDIVAPFRGCFGAENVAVIAAVSKRLGISDEDIKIGFVNSILPLNRFSCKELGNSIIIDDSYNANPLSMKRMLAATAELAEETQSGMFLILGEMRELGFEASGAHASLGVEIASIGPKIVCWKGAYADVILNSLRSSGWTGVFKKIDSVDSFLEMLPSAGVVACGNGTGTKFCSENKVRTVFLIKGSRGNKLEEITAALLDYLQ